MISIIIVTYNSMGVLPNCLEALVSARGANAFELIVVDNASTDATRSWLQNYIQNDSYPFARVINLNLEENHGFAYANNRGLEKAAGEYFLLLNPDTEVSPFAIEKVLQRMMEDNAIGVAGCRLVLKDGRLDRACRRSFPNLWNSFTRLSGLSLLFPGSRLFSGYNLTYLDDTQAYEVDCVSGAFLMVSATVYKQVGGLDEDFFMYGEDIDWCYRIKQEGYKVWYEGSVVTLHLKGANGGKHSEESLRSFYDTMLLYYQKHYAQKGLRIIEIFVRFFLTVLFHTTRFFRTVQMWLKY